MPCTRLLLVVALVVAVALGASHPAAASNPPADLEPHAPLVWNPFGVQIYNVYWDNNWDANNPGFSQASIDAATDALTRSDYFEKTAQYGVPGRSFAGHADALGVCGSNPGANVSIAAVLIFMTCEKSFPTFGLPGDPQSIIFNVFVPTGTTIDNGDGKLMCNDWRAEHLLTATLPLPIPIPVYFAILPVACATSVGNLMSAVGHEDVEMLTDPAGGVFWYDVDSAPAGFPQTVDEAINLALHDWQRLVTMVETMHSEIGDLCEGASPYPGVPWNFGAVHDTPFGIDMDLASYWSNADHACMVGDSRVIEATFNATGLPAGVGTLLVNNYTRPVGDVEPVRENSPFNFEPSVMVGTDRYVIDSGECSGNVAFPAGSTSPATQFKTYTCNYRKQNVGASAIAYSDGCSQNALPRNDDGSFGPFTLPFQPDFFGTSYNALFVNNNGNVTFDGPMFDYTPFPLTTTSRVVIAPYFADVDTRSLGSSVVTWGTTTFAGRSAFCVLWADVGVGYYFERADKLNSFQLLLVDRSDIGPGDFDIVMNYDQIQWETGDASGGSNGLGGASARVGYANGDPASSFELPGSAVNGALLDLSPSGLIHGSRNSTQLGRYIYPVRNGRPPAGGGIGGRITDLAGAPVASGPVQICPSAGGPCIWNGFADSQGLYDATGLADGSYTVTAFPPAGSSLLPRTVGPVTIVGGNHVGADIQLEGPQPPPAGTTISPSRTGGDGLPIVYWHDSLTLSTQGCAGGTATYAITNLPALYALGALAEGPAGVYSVTVPPLYPNHGPATVGITIHCPDGTDQHRLFDLYIDPSGIVENTTGRPLAGATVTLYRSDSPSGPFTAVPDGSAVMAPTNRHNPDTTDASGHFGWNVITGYYRVRASQPGCHAPDDASQAYVESAVLQIPPAVLDLDLRLACADVTPPTTSAAASPQPNAAGWNRSDPTVSLVAADDTGGSGVATITYSAIGANPIAPQTVNSAAVSFQVDAEGTTTVTYFARDVAGNVEPARTLVVKLDKTAPRVTTTRTPAPNANGWNNVPVSVHFAASDDGSGQSGLVGAATADDTVSTEGLNQSVSETFSDVAGNMTTATVGSINIDFTPPTTTCSVTPPVLWPPNHKLVPVTIQIVIHDSLSGPGLYRLVSVTSSEPDNGLGDGDTAGDVQHWVIGTADTAGELRAERSGTGPGRTYSLTYGSNDLAGNTALCTLTVSVPHDG